MIHTAWRSPVRTMRASRLSATRRQITNRSPDRAIIVLLSAVALEMLALPYVMRSPALAAGSLLIWSATVFALVPCVQLPVLDAARDAPGLASSINIGAFNLGNALGAFVGAAVISAGATYRFLPMAGSTLALGGLIMVLLTRQNRA